MKGTYAAFLRVLALNSLLQELRVCSEEEFGRSLVNKSTLIYDRFERVTAFKCRRVSLLSEKRSPEAALRS